MFYPPERRSSTSCTIIPFRQHGDREVGEGSGGDHDEEHDAVVPEERPSGGGGDQQPESLPLLGELHQGRKWQGRRQRGVLPSKTLGIVQIDDQVELATN